MSCRINTPGFRPWEWPWHFGRAVDAAVTTRELASGRLALLLVQDIAAAHGGAMQIESRTDRENHFTDVIFTIPTRVG